MSQERHLRSLWLAAALAALPFGGFAAVVSGPAAPEAVTGAHLPVSPMETASRLLSQSLAVPSVQPTLHAWSPVAKTNLEYVLKLVPQEAPTAAAPALAPDLAARRLDAARPVLESAGNLQEGSPLRSAAVLSELYDHMNGAGLVPEAMTTKVDLAAAVRESGLSPAQAALIAAHSKDKRLVPVDDFLRNAPLDRGGYLLGTTDRGVYNAMAQATGLTHYREVYAELFGRILVDVTDKFLEFLHKTKETVVFLVPRGAFAHPEGKMTKGELEWYLANPEKMENVSFVFGAYDLARGEGHGEKTARGLESWRGGLEKSPDAARVAQRIAHQKAATGIEYEHPEGAAREEAIEEFLTEAANARYARERASVSLTYFQSDRGTYAAQEAQRGLFLELFPTREDRGRKPRAVFIPRSDSALFWRIKGSIPD